MQFLGKEVNEVVISMNNEPQISSSFEHLVPSWWCCVGDL